ncbi:MAG: hypothetical protein H7Y03_11765 [Chitinophagaceae bacterium]|nr:hypothetical protein [Chitinophagaceae bacterium]
MPSIEIHLNLFVILFLLMFSGFAGFAIRRQQLKGMKQKIGALENEMLQNHAEILSLQKEIAQLQVISADSKTPVVSIKETNSDDKSATKKLR